MAHTMPVGLFDLPQQLVQRLLLAPLPWFAPVNLPPAWEHTGSM